MQDPPVHIPAMIALWQKGIKLVIGQRVERQEGAVSRSLSSLYHRLIKKIALPYIPDGGYDLILFDRELRDQIVAMNETNINLVYLISWLRYPYATIPVTRLARKDGASGWTFRNKVKLFVDSIVGFSYLPIRLVSLSALLFALLFLSMTGYLLVCLFTGKALISSFWVLYFTCSCTTALLFAASVIAEYLWRTLESTRKRPPYIVDEVL
jgi:dolichol-phosphate mannosyltransferase